MYIQLDMYNLSNKMCTQYDVLFKYIDKNIQFQSIGLEKVR